MKYVGSFPVDDLCLDDQIVQLHSQLKALKVSLAPHRCKVSWRTSHMRLLRPSVLRGEEEEDACLRQVLHQRRESIRGGRDGECRFLPRTCRAPL